MIVLAVDNTFEATDGFLERNVLARGTREHFGDVERLRQEALDLAGAGDRDLVLFRQFIHAENGDDVLQRRGDEEVLLLQAQLAAFVLFRFFDAAKPGPVAWADKLFKIRRSQPIGWAQGFGILFDDLVAALCTLMVIALWRAW